ncbi:MAG: sulfur carrier protein ThiS [Acidibacillus sp.]|uniref:sulfur carrier protein ThiS n=1 Tax=Sulfoacidibacillus ferrooxidans TaxID=2005001 RepID=UPI001F511096|nr:sulfur carrier protein ThiS [Acidibacillus sp.]
MQIHVNGQSKILQESITVSDLIHNYDLQDELVAVERNGDIVPKEQFITQFILDGDHIEIVRFVGGG